MESLNLNRFIDAQESTFYEWLNAYAPMLS